MCCFQNVPGKDVLKSDYDKDALADEVLPVKHVDYLETKATHLDPQITDKSTLMLHWATDVILSLQTY